MSVLDASMKNRRLYILQSSILYELYNTEEYNLDAVIAHLQRLCGHADKAKSMGSHFQEVLRHASSRRTSLAPQQRHMADWIDRTLVSGFFGSSVSATPGEPPAEYAKRLRGSLHRLARTLGIHFRFVVVCAWQDTMYRSHAHWIVEVPNVVDAEYGLVSMAMYMVGCLPDGQVAIYPRVPRGGDAAYLARHLDSSRGMEEFQIGVACPCVDDACRGKCMVTRDHPQFSVAARYRRDYVPVPIFGVIEHGVFSPRGRKMNKDVTKRLKAVAKRERETRRGIAAMEREGPAHQRALRASARSSVRELDSSVSAVKPVRRKAAITVTTSGAVNDDTAAPKATVEDRRRDTGDDASFVPNGRRQIQPKQVRTTIRRTAKITPPEW